MSPRYLRVTLLRHQHNVHASSCQLDAPSIDESKSHTDTTRQTKRQTAPLEPFAPRRTRVVNPCRNELLLPREKGFQRAIVHVAKATARERDCRLGLERSDSTIPCIGNDQVVLHRVVAAVVQPKAVLRVINNVTKAPLPGKLVVPGDGVDRRGRVNKVVLEHRARSIDGAAARVHGTEPTPVEPDLEDFVVRHDVVKLSLVRVPASLH